MKPARSLRAGNWRRGHLLPAFAALFLSAPASAQERHTWPSDFHHSYVEIRATEEPGAVAEVFFANEPSHHGDASFEIEWNGIRVTVRMDWNVDPLGSERITVVPPEGFHAWPESITVREQTTGVIVIYPETLEVS